MKKIFMLLALLPSLSFGTVNLTTEPNSFSLFTNGTANAGANFSVRITNDTDREHMYHYKGMLCPDKSGCTEFEKWDVKVAPHARFQQNFFLTKQVTYRLPGTYNNTATLMITGMTDTTESTSTTNTGTITVYRK